MPTVTLIIPGSWTPQRVQVPSGILYEPPEVTVQPNTPAPPAVECPTSEAVQEPDKGPHYAHVMVDGVRFDGTGLTEAGALRSAKAAAWRAVAYAAANK